ncbi:MAG: FtsX-like permease family protein [Pseudomonadota bacterium]
MSTFGLVLSSLRHAWLRNVLLMLSVAIAYLLFGVLIAFERAYSSTGDIVTSRMITVNKLSFTEALPISHFGGVRGLESVGEASFAIWFGGYFRERRNALHAIAVDPRSYLAVYGDDLSLRDQEREAFLRERGSILVGASMAERFGWKVGDQVPIINKRLPRRDGAESWSFRIAGIFKGASAIVDTSFIYIHYDLVNEARTKDQNMIGWIVSAPAPGREPGKMGQAIDRLFEATSARTTTDSERSFAQIFVAQFGDLALVTVLILAAAFFSLLVIVASTTALAIRQRARETGILKAIGFSHTRILAQLIGESITVILIAGMAGLFAADLTVRAAEDSMTLIAPGMAVTPWMMVAGLASMLVLAVAASAFPAWQAVSASTANVLRRG